MRRLSVIIECIQKCDRGIRNTDAKEGFTHWWLDGTSDKAGYKKIIDSLPSDEKEISSEAKTRSESDSIMTHRSIWGLDKKMWPHSTSLWFHPLT